MGKKLEVITKMAEGTTTTIVSGYCPRCKYRGVVTPLTLDEIIVIPVTFRILFKIKIGVKVELKYCATCGYLKLQISQDNVGTLLKIETPVDA